MRKIKIKSRRERGEHPGLLDNLRYAAQMPVPLSKESRELRYAKLSDGRVEIAPLSHPISWYLSVERCDTPWGIVSLRRYVDHYVGKTMDSHKPSVRAMSTQAVLLSSEVKSIAKEYVNSLVRRRARPSAGDSGFIPYKRRLYDLIGKCRQFDADLIRAQGGRTSGLSEFCPVCRNPLVRNLTGADAELLESLIVAANRKGLVRRGSLLYRQVRPQNGKVIVDDEED